MSDIIKATYDLLDALDESTTIKNLTKYKNRLLKNEEILSKIEKTKSIKDSTELIKARKELFEFEDYKNYMKYYNELNLIVLKINKEYAKYTDTTGDTCHG